MEMQTEPMDSSFRLMKLQKDWGGVGGGEKRKGNKHRVGGGEKRKGNKHQVLTGGGGEKKQPQAPKYLHTAGVGEGNCVVSEGIAGQALQFTVLS